MVDVRWLWVPLVGASAFLALPGNSSIGGVLGAMAVQHHAQRKPKEQE